MDLIPAPVEAHRHADGGHVDLGPGTTLDAGPGTEGTARWLRATVGAATGLPLLPPPRARPARSRSASTRTWPSASESRATV